MGALQPSVTAVLIVHRPKTASLPQTVTSQSLMPTYRVRDAGNACRVAIPGHHGFPIPSLGWYKRLFSTFGKLAMGDVDSEQVQTFLNRISGKMSPKSVKNVWTTLRIMWNSAIAWKYVTGGQAFPVR